MKIIVEYNLDDLNPKDFKLNTKKEFFEKYYNRDGIMYSDYADAIYYIVDLPFMPMEGQRIGTLFGMCVVQWSYLDLHENPNNYDSMSRIVVDHE
jgi:hypothetical protein